MSQAPLFSPTVSPVSGLQLTNNLNSAIDALNTANSGNTAPTNQLAGIPSAGNTWLDTSVTPYKLKMYDGTSWNLIAFLDQTNFYWIPVVGGGAVNSIASAATTDLGNATNGAAAFVSITGVVTITSFGSSCTTGQVKFGVFTGVLTLTHNAVSLILPFNGSNITTAAGDTFTAVYLGGGNWRVLNYQKATGAPSIPAPTVQRLLSGTALTYTPTAGTVRIRVRMVGGGGGGGGASANNGNNGTASSFQVNGVGTAWTADFGDGGTANVASGTGGGAGGSGGTDGSTGTLVARFSGGRGSSPSNTQNNITGGNGAASLFGGAGPGGFNTGGSAAATNTGSGGGGAGRPATSAGCGGGAGEYVEFLVTGLTSATYTVGALGTGGAAGTNAGGAGSAGCIIIEEMYS